MRHLPKLTPGPLPALLTLPATELPSSLSKTGLYSSYARLLYVELKLGLEGIPSPLKAPPPLILNDLGDEPAVILVLGAGLALLLALLAADTPAGAPRFQLDDLDSLLPPGLEDLVEEGAGSTCRPRDDDTDVPGPAPPPKEAWENEEGEGRAWPCTDEWPTIAGEGKKEELPLVDSAEPCSALLYCCC